MKALKVYTKFLDVLESVAKVLLFVVMAVLAIILVYQVILRKIFSAANSWSEELARYLFIYAVMVGAALALRRNSHLQIDILTGRFSPKTQSVFTIVSTLLGIVFLVFLMRYSLTLCATATKTMSAALPISMTAAYISMPLGVVLMILVSIEVVLKNILALRQMTREGRT